MANKRLIGLLGIPAAALVTGMVALWEGKSNDPYNDLIGVATVCYGETRVEMRHYTDEECADMLQEGLAAFAGPVLKRNPNLKNRPNQLAAAVSLAYNIGPANYNRSTVARRFSQGRWKEGCDAFLMWNRAGGQVVKGLVRRREYERAICLADLEK